MWATASSGLMCRIGVSLIAGVLTGVALARGVDAAAGTLRGAADGLRSGLAASRDGVFTAAGFRGAALPVAFFAAVLATAGLAGALRTAVCFVAVFFAGVFFAAAFFAADFLAGVFFATAFFATAFFATDFFAAVFLTPAFFATGLVLALFRTDEVVAAFFAWVFFAGVFFEACFVAADWRVFAALAGALRLVDLPAADLAVFAAGAFFTPAALPTFFAVAVLAGRALPPAAVAPGLARDDFLSWVCFAADFFAGALRDVAMRSFSCGS